MYNKINDDLTSLKKILPANMANMAKNIEISFAEVENDLRDATEEIELLESKLIEIENDRNGLNTIDAGIGEIEWKSENMVLKMVMDALEFALAKRDPNKVIDVLELMAK